DPPVRNRVTHCFPGVPDGSDDLAIEAEAGGADTYRQALRPGEPHLERSVVAPQSRQRIAHVGRNTLVSSAQERFHREATQLLTCRRQRCPYAAMRMQRNLPANGRAASALGS